MEQTVEVGQRIRLSCRPPPHGGTNRHSRACWGRVSLRSRGGASAVAAARGTPHPEAWRLPLASYIYALGRVEPRFPSLAVEKEFAQATGRAGTAGLSDRQALHAVLTERTNRYLARQLCWVLTIEGVETYILVPRDPADLDLLVEAVRPVPRATDIDVVIGHARADRPADHVQRAHGPHRRLRSALLLRR